MLLRGMIASSGIKSNSYSTPKATPDFNRARHSTFYFEKLPRKIGYGNPGSGSGFQRELG